MTPAINPRKAPARRRTPATAPLLAAGLALCALAPAHADSTLLDTVHTIAVATQGVPVERTFTISTPGTYTVTLTDLGALQTPSAPLASVGLAVTTGTTVVGTPVTAAGSAQFVASTAGSYMVHVIGTPGAVPGSGPFGVTITGASNTQVLSFSDTLALPPAAAPGVSLLNDTFTVPASGTYSVTLTDLQFSQSLTIAELALTAQGSSSLLATLSLTGGTASATQSTALTAGTTYQIFAFAEVSSTVNAGLYTAVVRNSGGTVVYSHAVAVGAVVSLGPATLGAGSYALKYTDLAVPVALSASGPNGALITLADQVAARLSAAGSSPFTVTSATAGQYQLFALGTPATTPGGGSYALEVKPAGGGADAFSIAQAVSVTGGNLNAYTFGLTASTAGQYQVQLADYQAPQGLASVTAAVVQNGALVAAPQTAAGSNAITLASGAATVLVFAQAAAGGGVLGLFVADPSNSDVLATTQGVGNIFTSVPVNVTSTGNYQAVVTDLGFPANFATLFALITRGTTLVGIIDGTGTLPFTASSTGQYFVTFAALPATAAGAGTYGLNVGPAPAAPTVTLSSSASQVASGASASLTWSSENATACTASGGWSGAEPTSGSASTGALTSSTTFTLTCTGAGGSATHSVTITIEPPITSTGGGGGGGGELGALEVLLLTALAGLRLRGRRAASAGR